MGNFKFSNKCPYCGADVTMMDTRKIYNKCFGYVYACSNYPKCDSYVGVHKNSFKPLGRLANKELRALKKECHKYFDWLWKTSNKCDRSQAYKWLSEQLDMPQNQCHIGYFDEKTCQKVLSICMKAVRQVKNRKVGN